MRPGIRILAEPLPIEPTFEYQPCAYAHPPGEHLDTRCVYFNEVAALT